MPGASRDMAEGANGRIDLAAPLLSVRRRHAGERRLICDHLEDEDDDAATHGARGGVAFGWERRPGHPKSVRTFRRVPPPPPAAEAAAPRFSGDALSRSDSCFTANCSSFNGLISDAATGRSGASGVMMDRFLQAAKAVAADGASPKQQRTFRKAPEAATGASGMPLEPVRRAHSANTPAHDEGDSGLPRRLLAELERPPADPVQELQPNHGGKGDMGDMEEEWDEAHSTAGFAASRRCGLLPTRCGKGAGLLLLGPAQAMIRRSRRGARRRRQSETNPLLPRPRNGQRRAAEHSASMDCVRTWEEVYISSLLRSDRLIRPGTLASELVTDQAGDAAHRHKPTHLGLLLVLDRNDEHNEVAGGKDAKAAGGKTSSRNNAGHGFPPPLQENAAERRERESVVPRAQPVLVLPSPQSPSESWLSRALQPSVSNKPPPASTFLGIHVQQHKKEALSPWCSSYQTKVADHGRARHIRIYDLQK